MQNSVSDGDINEQPQPINNDIPAGSYDEVFPALSTPSAAPAPQTAWGNTNSRLRVGSSIVTQHFVIPRAERRLDNSEKFGGGGGNKDACSQIMGLTNTKIESAAGKDQAITFLITGKAADVVEAQKRIIANFSQPSETKVEIPKEYHRKLLGKGGQKLKDLEKTTGCKISVPSISDTANNTIVISGPRNGVEKALHEIKVTYDELSRQGFERVTVPKIYHPFISGPYNNNVSKWQSDLQVRINVPPLSAQNDDITIAGTKEGVQAAKEAIVAIAEEMASKCKQVSVEVPKSQHKYVIGPKGSFINEILEQTGVAVEMPSSENDSDTITLRGPQEKLGKALTMVCDKSTSIKTVDLEAPAWLHKRLKGKQGSNIRRIVGDDPDIHVKFSESSIKIEGPSGEVTRVEAEFKQEIKQYLASLVCEVLNVESRFFKHIIGKSGTNVNRLKEETGVEISISEDGATPTITIEGSPAGVAQVKAEMLEMISKLEHEKELSVNIDTRLIVRLGRAREIREQFPALQIIFPQQGEKEVKIRGHGDEVNKCVTRLREVARGLAQDYTCIEVPIYKKYHRIIIGKNGANIRKIRDETGVMIDLPSEKDDSENIVIVGKRDEVLKAKELIEKVQNDQANIAEEELSIDPKFYTVMIGARGRLIKSISEECGGVQIKFPDQSSNSDRVIVRGPKEDVQKAVQQLIETTKELQLAQFTDSVKVNPDMHKFLIGKSGSTIQRIRTNTGARVMFPSSDDADAETIVIMGKKEAVASAKAELIQLIEDQKNTVDDEMTVDPAWHKHFVKNQGKIIQRITEDCGGSKYITISFPRQTAPPEKADKVALKGSKEAITLAKQKIEEIVQDLESHVKVECVIPKRHHRTVMGKSGKKVQSVQSDFNVTIKFPDRAEPGTEETAEVNGDSEGPLPGDVIVIAGKPDDCEQAKQALLDLVPITITVSVPNEMHRSIIGRSGAEVRQLMNDYDVRIDVPHQDEKKDEISVSGAPANVEDAKRALELRVEELEKDKEERALRSFKVTVEIDPEYHSKIIGRRGAVISKIREDFDVNINLPQRGSDDVHIITITGMEDKANAARDHILSIVNEFKDLIKEEIEIDARVHSRLIGQRGRTIRKLMDEFRVEIKFPRAGDVVVITGSNQDDVLDAKEELLAQAERLLDDVNDSYAPPRATAPRTEDENGGPAEGFRVTGAPWSQQTPNTESITDFPSFGIGGEQNARGPAAWGPRR